LPKKTPGKESGEHGPLKGLNKRNCSDKRKSSVSHGGKGGVWAGL